MELDIRTIDMETKAPIVVLNQRDADDLGVNPLDRVRIKNGDRVVVGIVDITENLVTAGTMGVTERLAYLDVGDTVEVTLVPKPDSVRFIKKKLEGKELQRDELAAIIEDINKNHLNDVELGAYVSGIYTEGMSIQETIDLTEVMTEVGEIMEWDAEIVADKHSIGGVAGNRVTPIIIPIIAAAGITIPKTSSRAITSPAGTADTVEVLCDVDFSIEEIKEIVTETGGCMVWGGSVNLSPVDDKIIRAENPLSLDPEGQVLASVLSKKKSAGSTHIVIDIPYGEGSKVADMGDARDLAAKFKRIGAHIDTSIECTITKGSAPIGRGIGPVLEARDILKVLAGDGPADLKLKSIRLADVLLQMCGSDESARDILESGRAEEKFRKIIAAQNGDPDVSLDDLEPAEVTHVVEAGRDGTVSHIDNELISEVARRAGAPKDHAAGIQMHVTVGDEVTEGEQLYTVYAENSDKMAEARRVVDSGDAVRIRRAGETLVEHV